MTKALFIGTTGMLAKAAEHAAARADTCILAARNASGFSFSKPAIDARTRKLDLDYEKAARFLTLVRQHAPFDLALTWVRPQAEEMRNAIARMMTKDALLVEVLGSTSAKAGGFADRRAKAMRAFPHIRYAQVVLGFVIEGGTSRWLTHEEISAAAIKALDTGTPRISAGQTGPWEKRPQESGQ